MAISAATKRRAVEELSGIAGEALSAVAVHYHGIGAVALDSLRAEARRRGVALKVTKNSLAKRALSGSDFACMCDGLSGPTMLAFSRDEPGAAPRLIREFIREHGVLEVGMVAIDGRLGDASELDRLADLPTREVALAMLAGALKAPLAVFAGTLAAVPAKLARTLLAVKERKENESG